MVAAVAMNSVSATASAVRLYKIYKAAVRAYESTKCKKDNTGVNINSKTRGDVRYDAQ